jgi:hypothetical protein
VPLRIRRDGWTPERQRRFIALLAETRCPSRAARAVGLSRESAYRLRGRPGGESFDAAWNAALRSRRPEPTGPTARQRAFEGVLVPVTYRGRKVGERRKYDGRLAALLMRHFYAARAERKRSEALARMTKLMVRPSFVNFRPRRSRAYSAATGSGRPLPRTARIRRGIGPLRSIHSAYST